MLLALRDFKHPPSGLPRSTGFGRTGVEAEEAFDLPAEKDGSDERRRRWRRRRLAVRGEVQRAHAATSRSSASATSTCSLVGLYGR